MTVGIHALACPEPEGLEQVRAHTLKRELPQEEVR